MMPGQVLAWLQQWAEPSVCRCSQYRPASPASCCRACILSPHRTWPVLPQLLVPLRQRRLEALVRLLAAGVVGHACCRGQHPQAAVVGMQLLARCVYQVLRMWNMRACAASGASADSAEGACPLRIMVRVMRLCAHA